MIKTKCQECGKQISTNKCWIKRGGGKFCSRHCHFSWRSKNFRGKVHPLYKESAHTRVCLNCKKEFHPHNKKSKYCSYYCKGIICRGEKHPAYKKQASYQSLHQWILYHHGKAKICENHYCRKRSNKYEWSQLKQSDKTKKLSNFWQLCKGCHVIYDRIPYPVSKNPI